MILLDTNVISAVMRPQRNERAVAWLDRQSTMLLWTSSITLLELRSGLLLMPEGRRRKGLSETLEAFLSAINYRVLPFDAEAAESAGYISATRIAGGRNVSFHDTQVAGIALARKAMLATRNIKDFEDLDIPLVDPWTA